MKKVLNIKDRLLEFKNSSPQRLPLAGKPKTKRGWGILATLLLWMFALYAPQTVYADNASTIASAISMWNTNVSGALTVVNPTGSNVVTVTGTVTNASLYLELNMNDEVVVDWQASLSGNVASNHLIRLTGNGEFKVSGPTGKIENLNSGQFAIYGSTTSTNVKVTVNGGKVTSIGTAIRLYGSDAIVTVSSGEVSAAGTAIYVDGIRAKVTISGGTVSATSATDYGIYATGANAAITVSGGTVISENNRGIYATGLSATVTVSGGTVKTSSTSVSSTYSAIVMSGADSKVTVNGGKVISDDTGYAIRASGSVEVSGNAEITAKNNSAIYAEASVSEVNISGGKIENSSGATIHISNATTKLIVSGAQVLQNDDGNAIYTQGSVEVKGNAQITSTKGSAINSEGKDATITVSGGTISSTDNRAIYATTGANATIIVSGGTVSSTNNKAIEVRGTSAKVIVSGGTVKTTSTSAGNAAIVLTGADAVAFINGGTVTGMTRISITGANSLSVEKSASSPYYVSGTSNDLNVLPTDGTATAKWGINISKIGGIEYERGTNKGFFELPEETVLAANYKVTINQPAPGEGSILVNDGTNDLPATGGQVSSPATLSLTAYAKSGYEFLQWVDGDKDNPRTIDLLTEDITIGAIFKSVIPVAYTVTFSVTDKDGKPINDAIIVFDGKELAGYTVDAENGEHAYSVSKGGYVTQNGKVIVNSKNESVKIELVAQKYTVTFAVTDKEGKPINDAIIVFNENELTGNTVDVENGEYAYSVSKEGFVTQNGTVIVNGKVESVKIELVAKKYTVTFSVTDKNGTPINDAIIVFDGKELTGNTVDAENGVYDYSVSKDGYVSQNGKVTVNGKIEFVKIELVAETYTVTFVVTDEEGDLIEDAVVNFNGKPYIAGEYVFPGLLADSYNYSISKEGYEPSEGVVNVKGNITVEVELVAEPAPATYTVTFVVTDEAGDPIEDAIIKFDGKTYNAGVYEFSDLVAGIYKYSISKDDYITSEGEVNVNDAAAEEGIITVEVVLELEPEPATYTVTFVVTDEAGDPIEDAIIKFDDKTYNAGVYEFSDLVEGIYKYSISKVGYITSEGGVNVNANDADEGIITKSVVLKAKPVYKVTFDLNYEDADEAEVKDVKEGDKVAKPENPERDGYKFFFWSEEEAEGDPFDFNTPINDHLTLYAQWKAEEDLETYTVTFNFNYGEDPEVEEVEVEEGDTVEALVPAERDGFKFVGWFEEDADNAFDFTTQIFSDITLTAKWEEIVMYTVTFDLNYTGAPAAVVKKVEAGETVDKQPDPVRDLYKFLGWFLDDEEFDFDSPIDDDITLIAEWEKIKYTVTFVYGNGTADKKVTVEAGEKVGREPDPTRNGYKFVDWFLGTGTTKYDFSKPVTGNITITAGWEKLTGTGEFIASDLKVYPNPFVDILHIAGAEGCVLKVISGNGAIVYIQKIEKTDETLNLEQLPKGLYFIRLEKGGQMKAIKVVKD